MDVGQHRKDIDTDRFPSTHGDKDDSLGDVSQPQVVLLLAEYLAICEEMFYCPIWDGISLMLKERPLWMLLHVLSCMLRTAPMSFCPDDGLSQL